MAVTAKAAIRRAMAPLKPALLVITRAVAAVTRRLALGAHRAQYTVEWGLAPAPDWFDHNLELYWQWPASGNSLGLERGVFNNLGLEPGARVLELCCGDGFNAAMFYAYRASEVVAVDFDPQAITQAKRRHRRRNVTYDIVDIREALPAGPFDQVTWDAAIERFSDAETDAILERITRVLKPGGLLSGYALVERGDGRKHLPQHERELADKQELLGLLGRRFRHATVFETVYPERTNLYFYASDRADAIPFSTSHPRFIVTPP